MDRPIFLLCTCLAMAACSTNDASPVLTAEGYGEITFGVPLAETEEKLQQSAEPQNRAGGCSYVTFVAYPDIRFMIENGVVTRADAEAIIVNSTGFAAGDDSAELQAANPQIKVMPHKYEPESRYLILASADGLNALVFEESGGLITKVRAGVEPSVEYVEGCG